MKETNRMIVPDYCRSIVRSASRSIEERDLLGAIVDAPLEESPSDRNLICLSSIPSPGWNWCDGVHLSIFIENKDLKGLRFDKAGGYAA